MPPKRKGGVAKGAGGKRGKKAAPQAATAPAVLDVVAVLKKADQGRKHRSKVDEHCLVTGAVVVDDYDCMLNQTNIGHNNNKYYVIQVVQQGARYYAWNRWGRVGESGQNKLSPPGGLDNAIKEFKKKFKDKTKNNWDDRAKFKAVPGKYTMIEMDSDDTEEDVAATAEKVAKLDAIDGIIKNVLPCTLDKPTQDLVKMIFDKDTFNMAMVNMDIDIKKMPLGKLSKMQIAKGFEVLEQIEEVLKKGKKTNLTELTSKFYTLIPHNFGRQCPPLIADEEALRKKMDMLLVLGDIEIAQAMKDEKTDTGDSEDVTHPLDINFKKLFCDLDVVNKKTQEFKMLQKYLDETQGWRGLKIMDIWKVNRDGEDDRFKAHKKITNRKLLWHGTNVAVVAAILKGGMRIMPHSGGRVGKGIYFASENSKSACYVRCAGGIGIMFLNEVALGKEHHILANDSGLVEAPSGYDSVVAKGCTEPDPKHDTKLTIDGNDVIVPQGKPIRMPKFASSRFSQSEYLIYKENQCRIRYLLQLSFVG